MCKHLRAVQASDGWVVTVTETLTVHNLDDVLNEARYRGLNKREVKLIPLPSHDSH